MTAYRHKFICRDCGAEHFYRNEPKECQRCKSSRPRFAKTGPHEKPAAYVNRPRHRRKRRLPVK